MHKIYVSLLGMIVAHSTLAQPSSHIAFEVSFKEPQAHYAELSMEISGIKQDYIDVKMPVWTPGSYLVREFAKSVEGFAAVGANGTPIKSYKINKNTWRLESKKASLVKLTYRVYGFEVSVRTNFFDADGAFISPASTFMYVDGLIDHPAEVKVVPYNGWSQVSTGMEPVAGKPYTYYAPDFDILFDSPIEVGNQDIFSFEAAGVHYEVAMARGGNYDKERLKTDMAKIVESETAVFGENPNKRYLFIVHNNQSGGGGLEHLNSTVLGATRFGYGTEVGYQGFLGLVAHEHFHLWNVKRLRPKALGPFNYDAENYTTSLWIAEGFTAYYDNLALRRSGFLGPEQYLNTLCGDVQAVENRPGHNVQSLADASFDAWIKSYRPDENSANTGISYYNKGALMAAMLDLSIIKATDGQKHLDDVMKAMYAEYYKKEKRGYTDQEFIAMAEKVAGISLAEIYEAVTTAGTPDYNKYLHYAGLELIDANEGLKQPYLGASTGLTEGRLLITTVTRESGAWVGGLNVKDELLAVNGVRLDAAGKELDRILAASKVGDTIKVLVARDGLIKELTVTLGQDPNKRYMIRPLQNLSEAQKTVMRKWLSL
ncbi:Predicted metalloprotease, contains C-terminal PDZ domain [bacterium A37T11]|nr:Predicted metalloprotease, contains C-terminal PDZ domain [bacterium A37T11]